MPRESFVLAVVAAVVLAVAFTLTARARRHGAPSWVAQIIVGLVIGAVGAVAAVAPYADLVPDRIEGPLGVLTVVVIVAMLIAAVRQSGPARSASTDMPQRRSDRRRARRVESRAVLRRQTGLQVDVERRRRDRLTRRPRRQPRPRPGRAAAPGRRSRLDRPVRHQAPDSPH